MTLLLLGGCMPLDTLNLSTTPTDTPVRVARGPALGWQPTTTPNHVEPSNAPTYQVQAGDSLWSIAMSHQVDVFDLARWNGVDDPDKVVAGQLLYVRSPSMPVPNGKPDVMDEGNSSGDTPLRTVHLPQPSVVAQPDPMGVAQSGGFLKQHSFILPTGRTAPLPLPALATPLAAVGSTATPTDKATPAPKSRDLTTQPATRQIVVQIRGDEEKPGIIQQPATLSSATAAANLQRMKGKPAPQQWNWPVQGTVVASFGRRGAKINPGIDIAAEKGTPVLAPAAGVVAYVGGHDSFGNLIIVNHGGDYKTLYAHNDVNLVERGQEIRPGQMIARVGNTGVRVRSPRLHFEIRRPIKPLNPLNYLSK